MRYLSKFLIFSLFLLILGFGVTLPRADRSLCSDNSARSCLAPHYRSSVDARTLARAILRSIFYKNKGDLGFYGRELGLDEKELSREEQKLFSYDIVWENVLPEAVFLRKFVDTLGLEGADVDSAFNHLNATKDRLIKEWLSRWKTAPGLDYEAHGYYESRFDIMCFELSVIILARREFPELFTKRSDFDFLLRSILRRTDIVQKGIGGTNMDLKYGFDYLQNILSTNGEVIFFAAHELAHRILSRSSLWFNCALNNRVKWFRGMDEMFSDLFAFAFMEILGLDAMIDKRLARGADIDEFGDEHDVSLTHLRDMRPMMKLHSISYRDLAREFFLELVSFDSWNLAENNNVLPVTALRVPVVDIELMVSA